MLSFYYTAVDPDLSILNGAEGSPHSARINKNGVLLVDSSQTSSVALTPATPTFATVGVASAQALAANAGRRGLILVNTSSASISLGFGATAVLGSGITLQPGAVYNMGYLDFSTAAVNAIASVASSNLAIQEYTT